MHHDTEPDPRFTLANERTYLAWIRTAMAFIAAGVALEALASNLNDVTRQLSSLTLVSMGILSALSAHQRWRRIEKALRRGRALPTLRWSVVVGYVLALVGIALIVFR